MQELQSALVSYEMLSEIVNIHALHSDIVSMLTEQHPCVLGVKFEPHLRQVSTKQSL